ncbi:MAG: S24/S26 family peptidase [Bacteroidales bacterium]|nr:S24/S26 family peptidase [Bacteroidales bacterium]
MDKRVVANEILLEDAAALMQEGREVTIKPLGYSMLPFIRGGKDSVRLKKMPTVAVGDMLLVRLPGPRYVLHRLIAMDGDRLTLMGDGNLVGTESCTQADVLGTVVAIERGKRVVVPGNGLWWRRIPTIVRRYLLAIYRRIIQ